MRRTWSLFLVASVLAISAVGAARAQVSSPSAASETPLETIRRRGALRVAVVPAVPILRLDAAGRPLAGWQVAEQHAATLLAPAMLERILPARYYALIPGGEVRRALDALGMDATALYRPAQTGAKGRMRPLRAGGGELSLPGSSAITPDTFAAYAFRIRKADPVAGLATANRQALAAPDPEAVKRLATELDADALMLCQVDALTENADFRLTPNTTLIALDAAINAGRNPSVFVPGGVGLFPIFGFGVRPPFPGAGAQGGRDWETRLTIHTLIVSGWNGRVLRAATTVGREAGSLDLYSSPYTLVLAGSSTGFPQEGRSTGYAPPRSTLTQMLLIEALDRASRALGHWLTDQAALKALLAGARPR